MGNIVNIPLRGTVIYKDGPQGEEKRYGPGEAVSVPVGLARSLGFPVPQEARGAAPAAPPVSPPNPPPALDGQAARDLGRDDPSGIEWLVERFDVSPALAEKMVKAGLASLSAIRSATDQALLDIDGLGKRTLNRIRLREDE